jgi:hypothetical protein
MNLTLPAKVYSLVLISVFESAAEGCVAYSRLILLWGNPLFQKVDTLATIVLDNLQPLCNAIRKHSPKFAATIKY